MKKNSNSYNLVLFALPFHGHITPMLHIANALHSKGFSITIIHTRLGSPNPAGYPKFEFRSIDDGIGMNNISDEKLTGMFDVLRRNCREPFRDCLAQIVEERGRDPIACLISDPMWTFAGDVARSLNLQNLALRTGSVYASAIYNSVDGIIENGYYSAQETSPDMPLPEFPPLRVKDLPVLHGDNKQAYLHHFSQYAAATRASKGFICNSFDDLEPTALTKLRNDLPIPIFPIGPIHNYSSTKNLIQSNQHTSISWLNKQPPRSVLYVSYGSTASITESDFLELALGLAQSNRPFLWSVRPGLIRNSEWIEPLPDGFRQSVSDRGCIVKWTPQEAVLGHPAIGGFLSHCGWNSVLESVAEGVPMICLPCFADQMMNARCVSDLWRVGIRLENGPRREEIAAAIGRLMEEEEGREILERAARLKEKAKRAFEGSSCEALERLCEYILSLAS